MWDLGTVSLEVSFKIGEGLVGCKEVGKFQLWGKSEGSKVGTKESALGSLTEERF